MKLWCLLKENLVPKTLQAVLLSGVAIPQVVNPRGTSMTELASTICTKPADGFDDVDTPLPGREVCIVEYDVWVRAANLASCYWQNGGLSPLLNEQVGSPCEIAAC